MSSRFVLFLVLPTAALADCADSNLQVTINKGSYDRRTCDGLDGAKHFSYAFTVRSVNNDKYAWKVAVYEDTDGKRAADPYWQAGPFDEQGNSNVSHRYNANVASGRFVTVSVEIQWSCVTPGSGSTCQLLVASESMYNTGSAKLEEFALDKNMGDFTRSNDGNMSTRNQALTTVSAASECIDEINKYRNMAGKDSLPLCADKYQQQAQQDAEYDQSNGYHKSLSHFDVRSFCPPMGTKGGDVAQNEYLASSDFVSSCTWDKVMACFYNEGTDYHNDCCRTADTTGHRDQLLADHECASCGLATGDTNMYTNNFCTRNQLAVNATIVV